MATMTVASGSGEEQGALWGAAANDWAAWQEGAMIPVFEAAVEHVDVSGARVLDVACGSGLFGRILMVRGAKVDGVDAAEPMLTIARRTAPGATFIRGDMEALPYNDNTFDVVTAIDAFHYAADPVQALLEIRRVAKRGAHIVIASWGQPDRCESAACLGVLRVLTTATSPKTPGPYALAEGYALRNFVQQAGLRPDRLIDVKVPFDYPDLDAALRGILSAGPAIRAIRTAGRERVTDAIAHVLESFRERNGHYVLRNHFRMLIATRMS
jgi:ubiquinone/menaquinone biosynthesis C-methylase UbiE